MIAQSFIQELLSRIDITDVVGRYVPLKKVGGNFSACCPFHDEKTPSFTVSPAKQFYHCFGCGRHGNAINFLIEHNGMSFIDAVENLAVYAGLQVPVRPAAMTSSHVSESHLSAAKKEGEQDKAGGSMHRMVESMSIAARYYRRQLKNANHAIDYLKKRGLTGETAVRFGIGYAPPGWQNLAAVFSDYSLNQAENVLVKAGLVVSGDDGKHYDRFRNRIMFPILDQKSRIIGFGGRVLESGEPKYLNSPETPLFTKGRELYNLFAASKVIRKSGRALVVEGYMDVIVLAQHGIDYAVATLGTATTPFHIQKLLRQTDEIIFCFDGDNAGRKAAWRALENSLTQLRDGKKINFLFLPENEDPDSYIRKFGKESFEALLERAQPLSEFFYGELSARVNLQTSEGRAGLVQHAKPLLAQIGAPVLALVLIKRLSQLTAINQNELEEILQFKRKSSLSLSSPKMKRPQPTTPYRKLIQLILHNPAYAGKLDKNVLAGCDEQNDEKTLLLALVDFFNSFPPEVLKDAASLSVKAYFCDSPCYELLEKIEEEVNIWEEGMDIEAEFVGVLLRLQEMQRKQRMAVLQSKPLSMLTVEEKRELQQLAMS
ncbi:DNA primase [Nitrosomonas communis]|uniref:DNA primase n=1 Tax=Nitrosomonas communis TaxID=44574 RepID=UPI0026F00386|nr:DNA primase [Nitrosomonas communis]MCO6426819.1 DNA primase [Nitrosomonas communis]